ncbi:hypothetical protein EUTSA_v10026914mg [Eutrema salsugineum]|uniref:Knottin scorpion toxin-like domain-containing protein n=1 Tax=Eutrema salsugineum TaxID=72664 RepID=V4MD04_EUTSA|nr:hypothetical protein EUTSA_v10026914mg [Eutrema salsugineum]
MAVSRKCLFLVFLCLAVFFISGKPILIGTCTQFPKCNQTCIESHYASGKCIQLAPPALDFVCVCYPKYYI